MCGHHRHHPSRHREWEGPGPRRPPARDPEWAGQPDVRASDAEREEVAVALRDHSSAGRLDVDELDARLERAYRAESRRELLALLRDLPVSGARRPMRQDARGPRHADVGGGVRAYVLVNLLLVGIWLATGAEYFWPMWVILGWGVALVPALVAATARRGRPKRSAGLRM